jgi:hypothetical protein
MYIYLHVNIYIHIFTCIHIYRYIFTYICLYIYIYVFISMYLLICICILMYMIIYIYRNMYIFLYTYISNLFIYLPTVFIFFILPSYNLLSELVRTQRFSEALCTIQSCFSCSHWCSLEAVLLG